MSKFIFTLAGDMTRDPAEIAQQMFAALQAAANSERVEPSQRSLSARAVPWTAEERRQLERGELRGGFAGKGSTFPIAGEADVADAWALAGQADQPDAVRSRIVEIATEFGWAKALPRDAMRQVRGSGE